VRRRFIDRLVALPKMSASASTITRSAALANPALSSPTAICTAVGPPLGACRSGASPGPTVAGVEPIALQHPAQPLDLRLPRHHQQHRPRRQLGQPRRLLDALGRQRLDLIDQRPQRLAAAVRPGRLELRAQRPVPRQRQPHDRPVARHLVARDPACPSGHCPRGQVHSTSASVIASRDREDHRRRRELRRDLLLIDEERLRRRDQVARRPPPRVLLAVRLQLPRPRPRSAPPARR
jgi:hypothetical protein